MCPTVHSKGTSLYEGFGARLIVASVRALIGVYSIMTLQVRFPIETLDHRHAPSVHVQFIDNRKSR